jgi:hypothetical protein
MHRGEFFRDTAVRDLLCAWQRIVEYNRTISAFDRIVRCRSYQELEDVWD